uniref:Uncharacterized protein n=1 Tax=Moniliophthora roreri TaxID=221103 RepID=A0A0W0FRW8_MONRR
MESTQEVLDIEDWDSYKGQKVEDEKPLVSPLTDIRAGLDSALAGELHSNGTFAHSTIHSDAPNPCLCLDGVGTLGLPLNDMQSRMIIEASILGMIAEPERGVWRFPGDKIVFENPRWDQWLKQTVVSSIHTALDATSVPISVVECRLRYLVIHGPYADAQRYTDNFAEGARQYGFLSIILPSRHSGGNVHCDC